MADGRLSLFAAGMSEYLLAKQRNSLPEDGGEILIGRLSENGFGLIWDIHNIAPVTVVHATNNKSWRVHIHSRAVSKISEQTSNWPTVETGGVLMGRVSEASRTAHIVDVLDSPEDSHRSASEFVLGIKGLRQRMKAYSEAVRLVSILSRHLAQPSLSGGAVGNGPVNRESDIAGVSQASGRSDKYAHGLARAAR